MSDIQIHEDPLPLGPMTKKVLGIIADGAPTIAFKTRGIAALADELYQQALVGQFPMEVICWGAKPECQALSLELGETVWGFLNGIAVIIKDSPIVV